MGEKDKGKLLGIAIFRKREEDEESMRTERRSSQD